MAIKYPRPWGIRTIRTIRAIRDLLVLILSRIPRMKRMTRIWSPQKMHFTIAFEVDTVTVLFSSVMPRLPCSGIGGSSTIDDSLPHQGTIGKSSEITISLNFTTEHAESAEALENPARIGMVLKL